MSFKFLARLFVFLATFFVSDAMAQMQTNCTSANYYNNSFHPGCLSWTDLNKSFAQPPPIGNQIPNTGSFSTLSVSNGGTLNGSFGGNPTFTGTFAYTNLVISNNALIGGAFTLGANAIGNRLDIYATGIVADGTTSDDITVKAAIDKCNVLGGILHFPAGQIRLTGAATSTLNNCWYTGSGVIAGAFGVSASRGTMFLLTSTSVKPFIAGNNWRMSGVSFYWPNQTTGTTSYPPLLNCDVSCVAWSFDHNSVINAYDFFNGDAGAAQGAFKIHHNWLYATGGDLIRSSGQGDNIEVTDNQMTPGNWFRITNNASAAAASAGSLTSTIFHLTNNAGFGWNIIAKNNAPFGWKTGFKLDSTAVIGISDIDMTWDGVETLVDNSAGGQWGPGVNFTGSGGCSGINLVTGLPRGNSPCFKLGANGLFRLSSWTSAARATFITTAGANVEIYGLTLATVGTVADGADYYVVDMTANPGGLTVQVKASTMSGLTGSTKVHGIGSSTAITTSRLAIQDNEFLFFNDDVTIVWAPTTIITGNWSAGTQGSVSFVGTGSGAPVYESNNWDKPPLPTIASGFGTTPSLMTGLDPRTFQIDVGTGGTALTGAITIPIPAPHGFACTSLDRSHPATADTVAGIGDANGITVNNYARGTATPTAWAASDLIQVSCKPY